MEKDFFAEADSGLFAVSLKPYDSKCNMKTPDACARFYVALRVRVPTIDRQLRLTRGDLEAIKKFFEGTKQAMDGWLEVKSKASHTPGVYQHKEL